MGRQINNRPGNDANVLDDLCCRCYQGDYVLVVGDDVLLKENLPGGQNCKDYFDGLLKRSLDEEGIEPWTVDWKAELSDLLASYDYDVDRDVNPDLVRLLETKCFRLVMTTAYDRYPELLMRRIWGDQLKVINIYENKDRGAFFSFSEYDIVTPTLVYVMGRAGLPDANTNFAYSDDDVIELIARRWLDSANKHRNLIECVSSRNVLGIGCKFDDWEFRFFWYSLRQDLRRLHGDVAISLDVENSDTDRKLARYLKTKKIRNKGNARLFLHELAEQLNDPDKYVYERMAQRMQSGGVFISYAFEDFPVACHVCKILQEKGFNVWLDNRELHGGDRYDDRISDAIAQCRAFIPLLSAQTRSDLSAGKTRYYMSEWEQMSSRGDGAIIPLALPGFDIRTGRDLLPGAMRNVSVIEWSADGAVEKLIDSIICKMQ